MRADAATRVADVTLRRLLLVMLGGMLGTAGRLALGLAVQDAAGVPVATLLANVLGALLIGVLAARPFGRLRDRDARAFFMTGILGGFTTYSAFAVGSIELWANAPLAAVAYSVLTLGLGIGAVALGFRWGRPRERNGQ